MDASCICCTSISLSSSHPDWAGGWKDIFEGSYHVYTAEPTLNGKTVYEKDDYCMYWFVESGRGMWGINDCKDLGSSRV